MVETQTLRTPPTAPIDVPLEGRTHPAIHFGRNTNGKIGKPLSND